MRELRLPFVVTVAAAACGGKAVIDSDAAAGGASSSQGNSVTAGSGASGPSGSSVTTGAGGNSASCPASPPTGYDQCDPSTTACRYDVSCQSGTVELTFTCPDGWWQLTPTPCTQPFDSCPGTEYYCDGSWWMPTGSNPPTPCPDTLPSEGSVCFTGGMGGVWENCGYYCSPMNPNSGWTVATCVMGPNNDGSWQHDGVCGP